MKYTIFFALAASLILSGLMVTSFYITWGVCMLAAFTGNAIDDILKINKERIKTMAELLEKIGNLNLKEKK